MLVGSPASGCLHREDPATLGAGSPGRFSSPRECPPWDPWGSVSLGGTLWSPFLWSALEPPMAMPGFCQNRHQDQQDHASHAQADPVLQRVVLGGVGWKQKMEDTHGQADRMQPCPDPGRTPMRPEGLLPASPALGTVPGEPPVWEPESVGRGRLSLEPPRSQRELMTAWGSLPDSEAGLGLPRPSPRGESPLSLPRSLHPPSHPRCLVCVPQLPSPDPAPRSHDQRPRGQCKAGKFRPAFD